MKKLFFLFLAAALCLSLCACEKTQPEPPTLPDDGQQTQTPKPEENPNRLLNMLQTLYWKKIRPKFRGGNESP